MPSWTPELEARLASLRLQPAREKEIIDELSEHLELRYAELRNWLRAISPESVPEGMPFDSQLALTRVLGLLEALIQSLAEMRTNKGLSSGHN